MDIFGGYNHNLRINDNEFFDMQNLASDAYPLLSVRRQRGAIPTSMMESSVYPTGGMIYRDGLYYILVVTYQDHYRITLCGQKNSEVADIATWESTEAGMRTIVPMGAKLVIFPDKKVINLAALTNTASNNAVNLENTKSSSTGQGITTTIQPCLADGTVLSIDYVGDEIPTAPTDGYVWLDTRQSPASLKKFYATQSTWQSFISSYVKITANNAIGAGFMVGDGVKVSGITSDFLKGLNATSIIKALPDTTNNKSIVLTGVINAMEDKYVFTARETQIAEANDSTFWFLCNKAAITAGELVGKSFKIGDGEPLVCTVNNATDPEGGAYTWEKSDSIIEGVQALRSKIDTTQSGTHIKLYKNKYISCEDPDNNVEAGDYVSWSGNDQFHSLRGSKVRIGEKGVVAEIDSTNIIGSNPVVYEIVLDRSVEVPAGEIIYPVHQVTYDDKYMVGMQFQNAAGKKIVVGEKACPTLACQHAQTAAITFSRRVPKMDFVIESQNRLWGCMYGENNDNEFVNEIYCSKMGDPTNWYFFDANNAASSYAASCGTEGAWTGAVNYRGYPVFFKEHYIHTVYGSNPPYQITDTEARGIQKGSSKSLAMVNEILYYKGINGICAYNGGLPTEISYALGNEAYHDAVACAHKGKYYISMKDAAENPVFFVYDINNNLWHKEDDLEVMQFASGDEDVYYISPVRAGGAITSYKTGALFGSGGKDTDPLKWYAITGIYGLSNIDKQYIKRLNLRLMIPIGSVVVISIQYDSSKEWEQVGNIVGYSTIPFTLPIRPRRCDHFRLKLEGRGDVKLYSISKTVTQGSDI